MDNTVRDDSIWTKRLWVKRRPQVLGVFGLIVGAALLVGYLLLKDKDSPIVETARQTAQTSTEKGDYASAFNELKALEGTPMSRDQKIRLYSDLAAAAANNNKQVEAIKYLNLKHEVDPKTAPEDAFMLGTLYEGTGDIAGAIAQYELAIEYLKTQPQGEMGDSRAQTLQATISQLKEGRQ